MGTLGPNLLQRLDFKNFRLKKHMSCFTFSRTRTLAISTSLKYLGRLWQNILKDEMVCHNQMMGLPLKGSCMASIA
jgi:hypothetical protein